jgi:beta-galactosidase beta subunit
MKPQGIDLIDEDGHTQCVELDPNAFLVFDPDDAFAATLQAADGTILCHLVHNRTTPDGFVLRRRNHHE